MINLYAERTETANVHYALSRSNEGDRDVHWWVALLYDRLAALWLDKQSAEKQRALRNDYHARRLS